VEISTESYGHFLNEATGPRELGRGISGLPTDNERVLPMVSSGLAVDTEKRDTEILPLAARMATSLVFDPETDSA